MRNRRDFLKTSALGLGAFAVSPTLFAAKATRAAVPARAEDPHFFLQIYVYGGIDSLFLFDGRSSAMTAGGLAHAYLKEEPKPWTGDNGTTCLATGFARLLEPHRQRFSVVNGVYMSTGFDGHLQNVNFLYTGNPFGGESFLPHLNERSPEAYRKRPLDVIQAGAFALDLSNGGNSIVISADAAYNLIESLRKARPIDPVHPVTDYLAGRFAALGLGAGRFSAGNAQMSAGYRTAPDLAERLKRLRLSPPAATPDPEASFVDLMGGCFREGISGAALYQVFPDVPLDCHAALLARQQLKTYESVATKLRKLFDLLASTRYDDNRSLFDVTTVLVASEFGRTLRQPGLPLDNTGTDHNSLNNSLLVGGKGVRGGLVLGETDWRAPDEKLSGAHKHMDPAGIKLMGKPFDFKTGKPRADLPATFEADDYLHVASVTNTLYSLFAVPQAKWRTVKRDGPKAPVLTHLLT